jgi:hypothetical protein
VVERGGARARKIKIQTPSPQKGAQKTKKNDAEFERWLDLRIKKMFDSALEEPVPDDMLEILKQERKKR